MEEYKYVCDETELKEEAEEEKEERIEIKTSTRIVLVENNVVYYCLNDRCWSIRLEEEPKIEKVEKEEVEEKVKEVEKRRREFSERIRELFREVERTLDKLFAW
ncbi:MAG: hypothetical protein DRP01_00475 [Archaeoglobales archaeon]|nr:MAG: hypothetical protein DRP01_00475 [Archaeoglobales archaeon]